MKRILFVLAVSTLVLLGQAAHAAYLDSSWYAQLTNVQLSNGYAFPGVATSSPHISVSGLSNPADPTSSATFSVPISGQALDSEAAYWMQSYLAPEHIMGSMSFDYETYWTQPNLVLNLYVYYMASPDPGGLIWSSSRTGLRSEHIAINAPTANGYRFELVVVPEPASLLSLIMLFGTGGLLGLRRSHRTSRSV